MWRFVQPLIAVSQLSDTSEIMFCRFGNDSLFLRQIGTASQKTNKKREGFCPSNFHQQWKLLSQSERQISQGLFRFPSSPLFGKAPHCCTHRPRSSSPVPVDVPGDNPGVHGRHREEGGVMLIVTSGGIGSGL